MTAIDARLPVSSQQLLWCAATSNAFSPRFVIYRTMRISGHLDEAALQAALNDVVARHEALRTLVVRDADPPYQQVSPPTSVPLTVRELAPRQSRQQAIDEQLAEAEGASIAVEQLPLLRAILTRFDNQDSVLSLVSHHSACDGWSMNVVLRDLAECYAARTGEHPLSLPDVPQYQDYIRWQLDKRTEPAAAANMAYWRQQLDGARIFTLPTDRPIPATYTAPYVQYPFAIDADVAATVLRFVKAKPFTGFMVMLAAFNVLAHRISGALDPTISTMFHGRTEPRFKDTVGLFLNFLTMRTDLAGCGSFHDILVRTRAACLQAYQHEALHEQVLQAIPSLAAPLANPSHAYLVFGFWDQSLSSAIGGRSQLGQGMSFLRKQSRRSETLPGGVTWGAGMSPSGELSGGVQFNPEIFDEQTVVDWVADYGRILATGMADLDREWRKL